jgi:hypothetical protein
MVRAVLDGRKTQTRRVVKPQPVEWKQGSFSWPKRFTTEKPYPWKVAWHGGRIGVSLNRYCPYGVPGDRLWVRETFAPLESYKGIDPGAHALGAGAFYRADRGNEDLGDELERGWRPSIFMPRHLSRINLEVTAVRVERVWDISEEDAIAEGATRREAGWSLDWSRVGQPSEWSTAARDVRTAVIRRGRCVPQPLSEKDIALGSARMAFANLWDSINAKRGPEGDPGAYSWDRNPWVWVVEFEVPND